jgi:hypothetical protein
MGHGSIVTDALNVVSHDVFPSHQSDGGAKLLATADFNSALHVAVQAVHQGVGINQPATASLLDPYHGNATEAPNVMPIRESLSLVSARYLNAVIILLGMSHMTIAQLAAGVFACAQEPSGMGVVTTCRRASGGRGHPRVTLCWWWLPVGVGVAVYWLLIRVPACGRTVVLPCLCVFLFWLTAFASSGVPLQHQGTTFWPTTPTSSASRYVPRCVPLS